MNASEITTFKSFHTAKKLLPTLTKRKKDFRKLAVNRLADANLLLTAGRKQAVINPKGVWSELRRINALFKNPLPESELENLNLISPEEFETGIVSVGNDEQIIRIPHITDTEREGLSITSAAQKQAHRRLKDRERKQGELQAKVMALKADGLTREEIASKLNLTTHQVKRVIQKTNLNTEIGLTTSKHGLRCLKRTQGKLSKLKDLLAKQRVNYPEGHPNQFSRLTKCEPSR